MSDEVLGAIEPLVLGFDDPAIRMCVGTRLYFQIACRYPLCGGSSPASARTTRTLRTWNG
jgi:hypothetical protein